MNICLMAFALTLGCTTGGPEPTAIDTPAAAIVAAPPAASAPDRMAVAAVPDDRWIAEDKLRHFALSFAATQMGYGGTRFALEPEPAVLLAAAGALGLGIGKEVRDVRRGGPFSLKDLAWDAAGVALGVLLVRRVR